MLLIVTVTALAAVFVLHSLPCFAQRAEELQTQRLNRREQAEQRMSTATRERVSISDAYALVGTSGTQSLTLSDR